VVLFPLLAATVKGGEGRGGDGRGGEMRRGEGKCVDGRGKSALGLV